MLNGNKKQVVDKYQRMKEDLNEKERTINSLNNELQATQNEINVLIQKSQIMLKESKSETALFYAFQMNFA